MSKPWALYWLSCKAYTVGVEVERQHLISSVPPIARWALGKPLWVLERVMKRHGGFEKVRVCRCD